MTELTRRRDPEMHLECWQVRYGDIEIGVITQRSGVPNDVPQWSWHCGFYPASHNGIREDGIADTFEEARAEFEAAWSRILPQCTEADFDEHRYQRAFTKWKYKMWDSGCKMPTQTVSGMTKCFCGAIINNKTSMDHI